MRGEIFAFGEFELDATWRELRRAGEVLRTPAVVLRLLEALVTAAPKAVSREQLLAQVWKNEPVGYNTLTTAISRARALLGQQRGVREFIATSRQKGYRFLPTVVRVGGPPTEAPAVRLADRRSPRTIVGRGSEL